MPLECLAKWCNDNYLHLKPQEDAAAKKLNSFELHLLERHDSEGMIKKDDFRGYTRGSPIEVESLEAHNPINWWRDHQWLHHATPPARPPDTPANTRSTQRTRESLQQCQKIADTGEKCPGR
jgi:hypothetical protein